MNQRIVKIYKLFSYGELSVNFKKLVAKQLEENMSMTDGFELGTYEDTLKYFLPESTFAEHEAKFIIFGQGTHSGSLYAFYKAPNTSNTDEYPIIVLGDEGGCLVLAKNLKEFVSFLSLGIAPYIGTDYTTFTNKFELYEEQGEDEGEEKIDIEEFKNWIVATFGVEIITSADGARTEIINPAQAVFQNEIDAIFKTE